MGSFTSRFIQQRGGSIRHVTGMEDNEPAWYIVQLDPVKFQDYKHAFDEEEMDLTQFGAILYSGWGAEAPSELLSQAKRQASTH